MRTVPQQASVSSALAPHEWKPPTLTDWKLRFYGSFLGYVWTLARPFALFGVIYILR